jgi:hypothetical protein
LIIESEPDNWLEDDPPVEESKVQDSPVKRKCERKRKKNNETQNQRDEPEMINTKTSEPTGFDC